MFGLNKSKLSKNLKVKNPKLEWLSYSEKSKSNSGMDNVFEQGNIPFPVGADIEQIVRNMLNEEFSPDIVNSKSYELLVAKAVQRVKEQQMQEEDEQI